MEDTKQTDFTAERMARCVPVAKIVLEMLGENDLPIGNVTDEQVDEGYKETVLAIMGLFLEYDINYTDRHFVFQLVLQAVNNLKDKVTLNLETSFNIASERLWGKDINDVKLKDIDKVLKKEYNVEVV